jgi:hypothetical protein
MTAVSRYVRPIFRDTFVYKTALHVWLLEPEVAICGTSSILVIIQLKQLTYIHTLRGVKGASNIFSVKFSCFIIAINLLVRR